MFRLWCLLIGYVCGLIPTAYIVGKVKGIDIREHGSGNSGTTNALRVMGKRAGGIVLAGDLLKCFLGILITFLIFRKFYPDHIYLIRIYTAFGIILGHDYPFFLHFKGGKGIACFGGMVLSFFAPVIPACVITFFGTFFLTHLVSLSSIMLLFTFFAEAIIFGQAGFLGMSQGALIELYIVILVLVILALFQHRKNIVRLVKGEERRTYLKKKSEENISDTLKKEHGKEPAKIKKKKEEPDKEKKEKEAEAEEIAEEETERKPRIKEVVTPKKEPEKKTTEKKASGNKKQAQKNLSEKAKETKKEEDSKAENDSKPENNSEDLELEELMETIKESIEPDNSENVEYIELDGAEDNKKVSAGDEGKDESNQEDASISPDAEKIVIPEFLKEKKKTGKKRK